MPSANWRMLTGPLASLDAVWKAYGVSISADTKTGREAHNDVMDFIDAKGDLRFRATPFADESATGTFSLSPAAITRWGGRHCHLHGTAPRTVTAPVAPASPGTLGPRSGSAGAPWSSHW